MIPIPWTVLAVVLSFACGALLGEWDGGKRVNQSWTAKISKEREEAATAARTIERDQQEKVNEALRKQNEKLAGINNRLSADIDKLRQRPERPSGVPEIPRIDCAGANGAELGGSHAIFLARFAALAAKYDEALAVCYATIDSAPKQSVSGKDQ